MKARSLISVLLAVTACALFAARVQAQSDQNPDFSNVNDILHGNRTLLKMTDLQVNSFLWWNQGITSNPVKTSNSQQTNGPQAYSPSGSFDFSSGSTLKSFSGWMFNQPQAITVTTVTNTGVHGGQLYIQNIVNPPFWAVVSPPSVSSGRPYFGAMADFNLDGYDDFAVSYDDGTILVATAGDVNNPNAGNNPPFNWGPSAKLDVLSDMAAGDFNGDGHAEIAGLSIPSDGALKLVVYSVDPGTLAITPASSLVLNTGANNANPITHVSIARGKFTTLAHDQLAVAFATDSGQWTETVEIVDFTSNPLTPIEVNDALHVSKHVSNATVSGGWIQVKTGQFAFPNPYDQIVFNSTRPLATSWNPPYPPPLLVINSSRSFPSTLRASCSPPTRV